MSLQGTRSKESVIEERKEEKFGPEVVDGLVKMIEEDEIQFGGK